jgi:hypothetical protein
MSSSSGPLSTPEGPGSVSGAPNLPALTEFLAPYRDGSAVSAVSAP